MAMGINTFQHTCMSWSTRRRGNVHLNHIITKISEAIFPMNQNNPQAPESNNPGMGLRHPPRNPATAKPLTMSILAYSLKKKIAQRKPEYSVIQPATNSDSASGISKGVRFVSAMALIKKMKKAMNENGLLNIINCRWVYFNL